MRRAVLFTSENHVLFLLWSLKLVWSIRKLQHQQFALGASLFWCKLRILSGDAAGQRKELFGIFVIVEFQCAIPGQKIGPWVPFLVGQAFGRKIVCMLKPCLAAGTGGHRRQDRALGVPKGRNQSEQHGGVFDLAAVKAFRCAGIDCVRVLNGIWTHVFDLRFEHVEPLGDNVFHPTVRHVSTQGAVFVCAGTQEGFEPLKQVFQGR